MQLAAARTFSAVASTQRTDRRTAGDGWPMRSHEGPDRYEGYPSARRLAAMDPRHRRHRRRPRGPCLRRIPPEAPGGPVPPVLVLGAGGDVAARRDLADRQPEPV